MRGAPILGKSFPHSMGRIDENEVACSRRKVI